MDVEATSDLYAKVISRDTRAGGLDRVVVDGRDTVRPLFVLSAFFTNIRHDDSGSYIQCPGL